MSVLDGHYVLAEDGKTPVLEPDLLKWARWFQDHRKSRILKHSYLLKDETTGEWQREDQEWVEGKGSVGKEGEILVSTVFLAINHSFGIRPCKPVLWETMIFGGEHADYQERYTSYEDALQGHEDAVRIVTQG